MGPPLDVNAFAERSLFNFAVNEGSIISIETDRILENVTSPLKDKLHLNSWAAEMLTRCMDEIINSLNILNMA